MSNFESPSFETPPNPYASVEASEPLHERTRIRPTGVTVTGVLSCIAGVLSVIGSIGGIASAVFADTLQNAFVPAGAAGQAQRALNEEIAAVTQRYMPVNFVLFIAFGIAGILLLIGGIQLLNGRSFGRRLLGRTFAGVCLIELIRIVPAMMAQLEMLPIMERFMRQAVEAPSDAFSQELARFSMIIGIVVAVGWVLIKLGLYTWGYFYLKSAKVAAYCS